MRKGTKGCSSLWKLEKARKISLPGSIQKEPVPFTLTLVW